LPRIGHRKQNGSSRQYFLVEIGLSASRMLHPSSARLDDG